MRLSHFEALRPRCPVCWRDSGRSSLLGIGRVLREAKGVVLEGILQCPEPACQREYPVIDGVPVLVAGLRQFLADQVLSVLSRSDLSAEIESILGDSCGPGSAFDVARHHLGAYVRDHYGEHDPAEAPGEPRPGAARRLLELSLELSGSSPGGPCLDLGCGVGGTSFTLAERTGELVLGVDYSFGMVRFASRVLLEGRVTYPRRRVGVVYDRRDFAHGSSAAGRVDFWCADALSLPFADQSFSRVAALNLLDCVSSPRELLAGLRRVLQTGGAALLTSPYDWSPSATPIEGWLGGHSQRGAEGGASEPVLRALLTPGAHPATVPGLELVAERNEVPWQVRLHDRSLVSYLSHLVVARRVALPEEG